ncbi:MAG: DUF47 family protein [Eubacteriales bacterium]|nr:DUF47 family protein [Eubacteriales bacterium]
MAKKSTDYFDLIKQQTACCMEASNLLNSILCNYNAGNINVYRKQMHELEHTADDIHHSILIKLSTEFITPIDQEDVLRLVQTIDDITDALDEVILEFYMYHIDSVPEKTAELSMVVNRCVCALHKAVEELKNFKKPDTLRKLLVKVNDIEAEADIVYTDAIYKLFSSPVDGNTTLGAKAIYESLEHCCDMCEHAADVIEQVVIKNT